MRSEISPQEANAGDDLSPQASAIANPPVYSVRSDGAAGAMVAPSEGLLLQDGPRSSGKTRGRGLVRTQDGPVAIR